MPRPAPILQAMPCPECKERAADSEKGDEFAGHRIGNRRSECHTCNRFNQAVQSRVRRMLKERHAEEYNRLRLQAEHDLYIQFYEQWLAERGLEPSERSDDE
jgi:hypothetical protein